MGQQIGGALFAIGGRVLGGFLGGPVGALIGGLAGGLIGSMLFNRAQKPLIPDYQLASSSYGHPIPIIYGNVRLPGTMIWESDIVTKSHGVGKGSMMGGQNVNTYQQSGALAFCEGPAVCLKVWTDGKLFLDMTQPNPKELTKYQFVIREYTGTETQMPDPLLQRWVYQRVSPPNSCPAYRGLAYLVMQDVGIEHFGNRFPNITALWSSTPSDFVITRKLNYWADDITPIRQLVTGGSGATVDWAREIFATLSLDGAIRVFDLRTGICIQASTWVNLFSPDPPPTGTEDGGWVPPGHSVAGSITSAPGSYIYVGLVPQLLSYIPIWNYSAPNILQIDPNTLKVVKTITLFSGTPAAHGLLPNEYATSMVAFTLVSPLGAFDMIAGIWIISGVFIAGTAGAGTYSKIPGPYSGIFSRNSVVIGKQDPIAGMVEVWWLSWAVLSPNLELWKTVVVSSDASIFQAAPGYTTHEATITPADYGVATPVNYNPSGNAIYDASDNTLIISDFYLRNPSGSNGMTLKWSPDTKSVVWVHNGFTLNPNMPSYAWDTNAGRYGSGFTNSTHAYWVNDSSSGAENVAYSVAQTGLPNSSNTAFGYSSSQNGLVVGIWGTNDYYVIFMQRRNDAEVSVAAIIRDICHRAGLDDSMIDVSLVTDTTHGYAILEQKSFGSAVADLCHTYQIDMVESDYVLRFVPRGQPTIATITQDELGSIDAQDSSKFWQAKHAIEQEMPLQINVRHVDPDLDYQANASYSKRVALPVPTQFSRRTKTIDLPVVSNSLTARHIAEKWLYTMWAERDTFDTALSWKYLWLDPTDNVTVNLDNGDSYPVRIESVDIGADYSLRVALASEDTTTYVNSTSPGASVSFLPQVLVPSAFIDLLLLNTPLLRDADDLGGVATRIYFAGGPTSTVGPGTAATLYKSTDGSSWPQFANVSALVAWARAMTALPDTASPFAVDYDTEFVITVLPGSDRPASCTYTDMMNGVNAAVVGDEIIQFQNASTNLDGTVSLTLLLRGRRGTEWATGGHHAGEAVIFLDQATMQANQLPLGEMNINEFYRLVPIGRTIDQTPIDAWTYKGYDLKPYAPVQFKRAVSGSDLVLTWKRRTRIGGLLQDGTDTVPLNEESEVYEVYLLASGSALAAFDPTVPATYVRAFTGLTAATVTYTAAMMTADGFVPATATLFMVVYQLSAVVGRGFRGYQALPPF